MEVAGSFPVDSMIDFRSQYGRGRYPRGPQQTSGLYDPLPFLVDENISTTIITGMIMASEKLLSVPEAAEVLSLSNVRVRQLCQQGRIGEKIGRNYILTEREVKEFAKKTRPAGRPAQKS